MENIHKMGLSYGLQALHKLPASAQEGSALHKNPPGHSIPSFLFNLKILIAC